MTSEQALRRIRNKIFDYPESKQAQADRVLHYLKARYLRNQQKPAQPIGKYSGLSRSELRRTGTCEADWF